MKSGLLKAVGIHPPAYGNGRRARMEDLALFTGGTFLSEELGYTVQDAALKCWAACWPRCGWSATTRLF